MFNFKIIIMTRWTITTLLLITLITGLAGSADIAGLLGFVAQISLFGAILYTIVTLSFKKSS